MASKYDTELLTRWALWHGRKFWKKAQDFYGKSCIGEMPEIKMNPRLTSTGGRAFLNSNYIDLSCFLMLRNQDEFANITIPHELCHHIAWRMYRDKGHGRDWKRVMVQMGLAPDVYHKMETLSMVKAKAKSVPA